MFKLSTTNTHEPSGSVATVCSMWLAKSLSVRVGPIVGRSNSPVVTTKLPIRHNVPCRVVLELDQFALPRDHRLAGGDPLQAPASRSSRPRRPCGSAGSCSRSGAARYVSQTALTCSSNCAGSFSVVLSQ